ncbi:hypothetical protein DRP77_05970, partial [Candidatus Poribacteria bacterium]
MRKMQRPLLSLLAASTVLLGGLLLNGCAPLGPQEPLMPVVEGDAKFSDRFELQEQPQFFYDLFGRALLEGNEVWHYKEEKQFDEKGNLAEAWDGQLEGDRYGAQLDHTILTEDTYRGRHTEFAIGDYLRLKPETLFNCPYIIRKTEFDGFRWDISLSRERHMFTLLHSRISNPIRLPRVIVGQNILGQTKGRRTGTHEGDGPATWVESAHLYGFRAQGLLGDILRVGFTAILLSRRHPQRPENPITGCVPNTPPYKIVITFRDDSPEDERAGAAFAGMKIYIVEQKRDEQGNLLPEEKKPPIVVTPDDVQPTILPDGTPDPDSTGGERIGRWQVANGFDSFQYVLDLEELVREGFIEDIRTVKSIEFEMEVAGDYYIEVVGYSHENEGDPTGPWLLMDEFGRILMPFRDVIQAEGNVGQEGDFIASPEKRAAIEMNPEKWNKKTIRYKYGAARGAAIYGVDIEGTIPKLNVYVNAQYAINVKYKQYPTVSKENIDFGLLETYDPNDPTAIPPFSACDGEKFSAKLGGKNNDQYEKAWFVHLKGRFTENILAEASFYHIDPGYTTTYFGLGANTDRDEVYRLPRSGEAPGETAPPIDEGNYWLIEDDDDNDDWPDSEDYDGVLPRADDRDMNGILDYQEDFLIFEADPPIFSDIVDLNHNRVIDTLEDDYEPDYPYGIDRKGFHITINWDILENLTLKLGWLNEKQVSSARKNDTKYLHIIYQRDIPDFGTILFQNRLEFVRDSIPDYTITLRPGEIEPSEVTDALDFYNARVNTTTLQFMYTAIPNLTLETKLLLVFQKQYEPSDEEAIRLDDPETEEIDERIDFRYPEQQIRASGEMREYPFYPDPELLFNKANWKDRRYPDRSIRQNTWIFKTKYEIPLGNLPILERLGEELTLTPMFKYIYTKNWDRKPEEMYQPPGSEKIYALNYRLYGPTHPMTEEYLRYNQDSREIVELIRLDYQFTQRMTIIGGFQFRRFINKDKYFENYLDIFRKAQGEALRVSELYRPTMKTRTLVIQALNRGEWMGFNVVILLEFRHRTDLKTHVSS